MSVPNTFTPNTTIRSSELNTNFAALDARITALETAISNIAGYAFIPRTGTNSLPASFDYDSSSDHSWTTYDASSIVSDTNAAFVLIRAITNGGSANSFEFRKDSGTTGAYNDYPAIGSPNGAGNTLARNGSFDILVPLTTSRTFDHQSPYSGGTPNTSSRKFAIIGWYVPIS